MNAADIFGRILCGLGIYAVNQAQMYLWTPSSSKLNEVSIFICTAALANAVCILLPAALMRGSASYDMQRLAFCAIVVNFFSFIAFAAKSSPLVHLFNDTITVISYAQLARLLWPGYGNRSDNSRRFGIFRFVDFHMPRFYMEKKK